MSEFTYGLLYRSSDAAALDPLLDNLAFVNDHDILNDTWHVATLDQDAYGLLAQPEGTWPEDFDIHTQLQEVSQAAPLLFFYNAEDHGWGYQLLHQGREVACFDLSYEADYFIAEAALKTAHPDQDIHQCCTADEWETAHKEARASSTYLSQLRKGRLTANPAQFAVFGLAPKALSDLDALLSESSLLHALGGEAFFTLVERFKAILGIEEMSWIN
jgi:hypothetical protein